eukprot:Skav208808  [mRNA]  locus=scaffold349:179838:186067:+ [translate_table: standard]
MDEVGICGDASGILQARLAGGSPMRSWDRLAASEEEAVSSAASLAARRLRRDSFWGAAGVLGNVGLGGVGLAESSWSPVLPMAPLLLQLPFATDLSSNTLQSWNSSST